MWVMICMFSVCMGQENSRDVMHELGRGDKGQEMSWGRCIWVQMDAIGYTHMKEQESD